MIGVRTVTLDFINGSNIMWNGELGELWIFMSSCCKHCSNRTLESSRNCRMDAIQFLFNKKGGNNLVGSVSLSLTVNSCWNRHAVRQTVYWSPTTFSTWRCNSSSQVGIMACRAVHVAAFYDCLLTAELVWRRRRSWRWRCIIACMASWRCILARLASSDKQRQPFFPCAFDFIRLGAYQSINHPALIQQGLTVTRTTLKTHQHASYC
jgi:hypothetical protein